MNERISKEVEKIKEEWEKEIVKLEPLEIPPNTLNNSLNAKRIEISKKYMKQIREVEEFNIMYKILKILQKEMDLEEFDKNSISAEVLGISKPKWSRIIGMLVKNGYVTGIEVWNVPEHNYPRVCISRPEITLQGLEYLRR